MGGRCHSPPCENMSPTSRDGDTKPFPSPDTVCPWSLRVRRKPKTYLVNPSHCACEKLQDKPLAPHKCRSHGVSASKPKLSLSALSFLPLPSPTKQSCTVRPLWQGAPLQTRLGSWLVRHPNAEIVVQVGRREHTASLGPPDSH